jgi:MSHA biogenesis protein MshK
MSSSTHRFTRGILPLALTGGFTVKTGYPCRFCTSRIHALSPSGRLRRENRLSCRFFIPLLLLAATGMAHGENLPDPTRPPVSLAQPQSAAPGASGVPALQSILLGAERRAAILDGRVYREGETIGEYKLGKITRKEVWLNGPDGELTLRLTSPAGNLEKKRNRR